MTITGTNFASGATVTFGSTAATNVVVVSSTTITATTPAGTAGAVTVTVTVSGQSGSLVSALHLSGHSRLHSPCDFAGALDGTSAPTYVAGQEYLTRPLGPRSPLRLSTARAPIFVVMFLGCHNNTVFTITDSYGNTWLPLAGPAYKVGTASFPMEGELSTPRMQQLEQATP